MAKKALVVSGGGCKGAFAVGVLKSLAQNLPDLSFDIFVGTSTGALVVPLAASDNLPLLERLYTTVRTKDIVTPGNVIERFRFSVSLFDSQPLANLVMQYINNDVCNELFTGDKEVFIVTTCLQTAETVIWSTKQPPSNTEYNVIQAGNATIFRRAVVASANQPVFMQPISILDNQNPPRQYVDGGVREYLGVQIAIDAGAEEIYAISLAPPKREEMNQLFEKTFPILGRTMDIFIEDVGWNDLKIPRMYNKALRYVAAVQQKMRSAGIPQNDIDDYFNIPLFPDFSGKKPLKIHHIFPNEPLGGGAGGLEFEPTVMTEMMRKGEQSTQNYVAGLARMPEGNV